MLDSIFFFFLVKII